MSLSRVANARTTGGRNRQERLATRKGNRPETLAEDEAGSADRGYSGRFFVLCSCSQSRFKVAMNGKFRNVWRKSKP